MAGILDFVKVAADGAGKRILNLKHLAFLAGNDAYQQITGIADPDDPTIVGKVVTGWPAADAGGQVTREARDNFDSGLVTLTDAFTEPTATLFEARAILLCNLTGIMQPVTVCDHTGKFIFKNYPLQGAMSIVQPLYGLPMVGVQWKVTNTGTVEAQVWGRQ